MKKALSLILAAIMSASVLAGCTTLEGDDKGAIIDMYLTTEVYDFDPQSSIIDDAQLKALRLCWEGLTTIDENGKWQKALMKNYSVEVDDGESFSIIVNLKDTRWSDGRTVQAADFVYSWKRLLEAEAPHEAAALLYDIKNARDIKMGDATIDDLGVAAVDTYVLQIEFEEKIDLTRFFENCSSLALVPLREDVITRYGEDVWGKKAATIVTNGPFQPRELTEGKDGEDGDAIMRLERSAYYYLDPEKEEALDKYVIPFRLLTNYSTGDASAQLAAYEEGKIFYNGEIPMDKRAELKDSAVITDMMTTHTYVFNTKNPLFEKAEVRRALSMALDRVTMAEIAVYADPAAGYIPGKVLDTAKGTSFRQVGGELISAQADAAGAKALLQSAGVTGGSFTITVRGDNPVDLALADYVKGVWTGLGFDVTVEAAEVDPEGAYVDDDYYAVDDHQAKYDSGEFDVIAIDMNMLSPDAFGALAQFSAVFSGNGVDMNSETYDVYTHVSGYSDADYDALIESAFAEKDTAKRAEILHQAEAKLLEDMPVCPVIFVKDAYLASDELSGISSDYYGARDFKDTKLKDYMTYKALTETAE
ncbi:MAG: hypothetical protein E7638_07340 [Ruminococcaceae bacterium]|nr:hypothetical protein [Oscillospiraceae bacterium]